MISPLLVGKILFGQYLHIYFSIIFHLKDNNFHTEYERYDKTPPNFCFRLHVKSHFMVILEFLEKARKIKHYLDST